LRRRDARIFENILLIFGDVFSLHVRRIYCTLFGFKLVGKRLLIGEGETSISYFFFHPLELGIRYVLIFFSERHDLEFFLIKINRRYPETHN